MAEPINHGIFLEMVVLAMSIIGFGSLSYLAYEGWRLSHKNIFLFVSTMMAIGFVISVLYGSHVITVLCRRLRSGT